MLFWLCNIKKEQRVSTNSLLSRLKLKSLDSVVRCNRLRWFRHMKQSGLYTAQILDLEVKGNRSCSRPRKCWLDTIKDDLRQLNLQAETCQNWSESKKRWKTASHTCWACDMMLMDSESVREWVNDCLSHNYFLEGHDYLKFYCKKLQNFHKCHHIQLLGCVK